MKILHYDNGVIKAVGSSFEMDGSVLYVTSEQGERIGYLIDDPGAIDLENNVKEASEFESVPYDIIYRPTRYKVGDGKILLNPEFTFPLGAEADTFNQLLIDMPRKYDEETINRKVDAYLLALKNLSLNGTYLQIDKDIAEGIDYLGANKKELTKEQKAKRDKAYNYKLKMKARFRIESEIGDIPDQIADIDKALNVLTGMVVRIYNKVFNNEDIPEGKATDYSTFSASYTRLADSGQYEDTADIRDTAELINKHIQRCAKKAQIVKTEYLENKR